MKKRYVIGSILGLGLLVSGCVTNPGVAILEDQKMSLRGHDLATMNGNRRIIMSKRLDDQSIVCAEPFPDFGYNVDGKRKATLGANLPQKIGGNVTINYEDNAKADIEKLYSRSQTIQYLRDSIYRLCEAAANGLITRGTYERLLGSTMEFTTTFLMMEMVKDTKDPKQFMQLRNDMTKRIEQEQSLEKEKRVDELMNTLRSKK